MGKFNFNKLVVKVKFSFKMEVLEMGFQFHLVQPKAQILHFFKPFLNATTVSIKPHVKANYRRHVKNKHSNYKAPTNTQSWSRVWQNAASCQHWTLSRH